LSLPGKIFFNHRGTECASVVNKKETGKWEEIPELMGEKFFFPLELLKIIV